MLLKTLNRTLEEYNIPKEEFWEDPYGFIDKLEDEDLKWRQWINNWNYET